MEDSPGIGVVVTSTSACIDRGVVVADEMAVPPPPTAIAAGIGVDGDGVIPVPVSGWVIETQRNRRTPPPAAAIGACVGIDGDGVVTGAGIDIGVFNGGGLRVAATAGCVDPY